MTPPRVSIGLPVFNGENYLVEAVECLLGQTFADIELIISDNASTDGTQAIGEKYAACDARVRYVRQPVNRGAGWNFSKTFRLARGEYFKWAAHDDLCTPDFVERCVERLDDDPGLVLCFSRAAVIDQHGRRVADHAAGDANRISFQGISAASEARRVGLCGSRKAHERYLGLLIYSQRCYEVFGVVRSSAMRRTGLHRPYNGAEKVFLAELALLGRFAEIDEVLFYSRWHDHRFSANASAIAQALHMNPSAPRRFAWPRQIRSSWGYLAAIGQLPLTAAERLHCLAVFGRYLLQMGKWQRVLREAITGRGTTALLPERTLECGDSSPLWSVAERPFLSFADGVKESGCAATESGDKSPQSKAEINA